MNKIFISTIALISFGAKSFTACNKGVNDSYIRAVNLVYSLPIVNWDSTITESQNSYDVFYCGNLIMYKLSYAFDSSVNKKSLLNERRNSFFVFQKDSLYGYFYYPKPTRHMQEGRVAVDSALKTKSFESVRFDTLHNLKPESSEYDADRNLVKLYNPSPQKEYPEKFSLYFFYSSKLNGIKETFSKKMDNVENMKLFKIKIIAHGFYYEQYKMAFPKREILYEMREFQPKNSEELMKYFDKYKKEVL